MTSAQALAFFSNLGDHVDRLGLSDAAARVRAMRERAGELARHGRPIPASRELAVCVSQRLPTLIMRHGPNGDFGAFEVFTDWLSELAQDSGGWPARARNDVSTHLLKVVSTSVRHCPKACAALGSSPHWLDWLSRNPLALVNSILNALSDQAGPDARSEADWLRLLAKAAAHPLSMGEPIALSPGLSAAAPAIAGHAAPSAEASPRGFGAGLDDLCGNFSELSKKFTGFPHLALATHAFQPRGDRFTQTVRVSSSGELLDDPADPPRWRHEPLALEFLSAVAPGDRPAALRSAIFGAAIGDNARAAQWCLDQGARQVDGLLEIGRAHV